jgi:glycine/D-amino acid oxidase-like deaminating enzyme
MLTLYPHLVPRMEASLHLYRKSVRAWQALQQHLGAEFDLLVTGGLMVAENAEQLAFLATKARRERALGLEVDILDRAALDRIAPGLGPAVVGAELCADEGKLNPLLCNAAIRAWATRLGVVLLDQLAVERIAPAAAGFHVVTAQGAIRAGRVVLAAGAATRALAAALGVAIPSEAEPLHMNITEPAPPLIHHLIQHAERPITMKQLATGQVVVGGGWPATLAGERQHPTVTLASMIGNLALAQHIVPAIAPLRVLRSWAGVNTTVDGAGVLGPVGGVPGLFVAIPGDAGYTLGPLSARLVADAMLGRAPDESLAPFSPDRFRAAAAAQSA